MRRTVELEMINSAKRHERREAHHERRETLLARLVEAEETLQALRNGDVDALVVRGDAGDRVYTLHGAEEPYRLLVEQMREGAVVLDVSGEILYANKMFAGFVSEPLEAVVGRDIGRFMPESERVDVAAFLRSGNGARRSQLVAGCGTRLDVYLSLATTVSPTGVRNLSLIVTDITELLEARGERDRAEHDSHAKNEFLAMLAHELRNPLGAIRNAVAVLESLDPANGPSAQARGVIERQAGHLSSLVDDLLDVERVASGKIRLNRLPLDLA